MRRTGGNYRNVCPWSLTDRVKYFNPIKKTKKNKRASKFKIIFLSPSCKVLSLRFHLNGNTIDFPLKRYRYKRGIGVSDWWAPGLGKSTCTCTCTYPVVNDRWGTTDFVTLSLHFILFSASLTAWQNFNPVHSAMLFSQRFFCRPLLLPPCTVPCKIVLACPDDLHTCPAMPKPL